MSAPIRTRGDRILVSNLDNETQVKMATDSKIDSGDVDDAPLTLRDRFAARRVLLSVCSLIFFVLFFLFGLDWHAALVGFGALAAAVLLAPPDIRLRFPDNAGKVSVPDKAQTNDVESILQAIPDPAVLLSASGLIVSFNSKAATYYLGLRQESHISVCIRHPEVLEAVSAVACGSEPLTVMFGERVPVERRVEASLARLLPSQTSQQAEVRVLMCLRDLTEQERINQMRSDFIANASHELRTPLASVVGFIETLQGPARDDVEARDRFLNIMGDQAARMSRLIDDLLSLSRVEMNVHLLPNSQVDVTETVRYVADTLEPLARESDVKLNLDVPSEAILVQGDRDELVQVFQNLVQNAIKYGHDGGETTIEVSKTVPVDGNPGKVSVTVTDTGPGISPEHIPRLTERFYRVDEGSSRKKGGTGLGLAIVKHVVNRHRGELRIASERDKGSKFTVLLDETPSHNDRVGDETVFNAAQ